MFGGRRQRCARRHADRQVGRFGRRRELLESGAERLNPVVQRVRHIRAAGLVHGDTARELELAVLVTLRADRSRGRSVVFNDDQAVIHVGGDVQAVGRVHGQSDRVPNLGRFDNHCRERAVELKGLHAVAKRVGHINRLRCPDSDTCGRAELPRRAAPRTPGQQELAVPIELLNAVVESIGHVHVAKRVQGDAARRAELARVGPSAAPLPQKFALRVEDLHAPVPAVHHVHLALRRDHDALRPPHLARTRA